MAAGENSKQLSHKVKQLSHKVVHSVFGTLEFFNPIIYLHSVGASKELWAAVPQEIANSTYRKSFVLDLRCHGDNEPSNEFNLQLLVEDLHHFMGSQRIDQAILIGHGVGGRAACLFALKHPQMVEMLVTIDAALKEEVIVRMDSRTLKYMLLWRDGVAEAKNIWTEAEVVRHAYEYVYNKFPPKEHLLDGFEAEEYLNQLEHPIKRKKDLSGFEVKHQMTPICEFLKRSAWGVDRFKLEGGRFEGRALFLMGYESIAFTGMDSEEINEKFPGKEVLYFKEAGHKFHLKQPNLLINAFLKFHQQCNS